MSVQFPEGEGIFETIRTNNGDPFALGRHIARASRSAKQLGLSIPDENEIRESVMAAVAASPVSTGIGRLRISFLASGEFALVHEDYQGWSNPARIMILNRPIDQNSALRGIKSLPYTENFECLIVAQEAGFDEGVRLNLKGEVCEGAMSNLLIRIQGQWCTPDLESGCLPGIVRELAIEWLEIEERPLSVEDLDRAESIFLLSSLKNLQPVSHLLDRGLEIDQNIQERMAARMSVDSDP